MFMTEISMDSNGSGVSSATNNIGDTFQGLHANNHGSRRQKPNHGPIHRRPNQQRTTFFQPNRIGHIQSTVYFPGQWINDTPRSTTAWPPTNVGVINLYYQPSLSNVATFTVQQEPVASYPSAPLPTEYWN